ncbi:hypothetical protein HETIRDRAFT_382156 [Heterobasidion irregulare TC 32-1]|uniref:assimilatory sulfite reductase (NADPH) n=1 Tax=Heterobasidion irregulare (strain TC 32-1) TaxID=747525 RepID=W4KFD5_HETIT|nr:uncharacterized protein HETIRDRAFT_382156 [Heterobasidion irregulare TC 32-1]ETW84553.1 hypothetical protein HETIRDRAFT_382156 [Heterobasidion irregulare TC 32-1]
MAVTVSGASTPLSASGTLTSPSPVPKTGIDVKQFAQKPLAAASDLIEFISSRSTSSSAVFVYDLAEQAGFGSLTKSWSSDDDTASVIPLQTRAGAGLSLVGRLSQGTSKDTENGSVLTAYTTPTGLAGMIPSLLYLPSPTPSSRLILHVPAITPVGDKFALSPTLAPLTPALSLLPENVTVLLSASPQESVDLAAAAYKFPTHVVHLFDHHSSAREVNKLSLPPLPFKSNVGTGVSHVLKEAGYTFFDYVGDEHAKTVLVILNGSLALTAKAIARRTSSFGVVVVRVLQPWNEAEFRAILPPSVKRVHVFDEVSASGVQGILQANAFGTLLDPSIVSPVIYPQSITPFDAHEYLSKPSSFVHFISSLLPIPLEPLSLDTGKINKLLFFSSPGTALSSVPDLIEQTFATSPAISSRLLTEHDVFSKPGGITIDRILLGHKTSDEDYIPLPVILPVSHQSHGVSNFLAVLDQSLLKSHSIVSHAKSGSVLLVATSWSATELASNLQADVVSLIKEKDLHLCTLDTKTIASRLVGAQGSQHDTIQAALIHLAFLRLYLGTSATEAAILKIARSVYGESVQELDLAKVNAHAWAGLVEVDLSGVIPEVNNVGQVLKDFQFNAIAVSTDDGETIVNGARLSSWHDAAKHLLFSSAYTPPNDSSNEEYPQIPNLRPEVPDRTYLVTCSVNRRLTPREYDRNVFHLEFDTSGTGLKYEIGEALGVHGWNDEDEVLDFCHWYGVDPSRLVTIPVPSGDGTMHTRTVLQALQQQVDLFGKPPKSFYTDLSEYARAQTDKFALQFIGSPEGASTFKKLSEKDTVTFADVLRRYASARPGIEVLCEMVGDIKPRHYSIASAQSVVGNRVDLLIVTVDWVTSSGSPRYGQCTRYLNGLKVGQKVTVSIKPSVMKLPPDNMQPLIMAGLGTGAAPFRAFLQHRAMLSQQNIPVGPVYYYFGSRRQSQEYLYGEEIEAFIQDRVITKAGLAFSRDGPKKVYIQHKMLEDAEDLARMLRVENGVFYLCGPTWPVPDVYEALVNALVKYHDLDAVEAGEFLEGLKEEERYVLEVY